MFYLRSKYKRLIENLGHDCKHQEFVKDLNHNPNYLDMSTEDNEVILDEALKFAKIFCQESLSSSSEQEFDIVHYLQSLDQRCKGFSFRIAINLGNGTIGLV